MRFQLFDLVIVEMRLSLRIHLNWLSFHHIDTESVKGLRLNVKC
jgi:hypothetical protein